MMETFVAYWYKIKLRFFSIIGIRLTSKKWQSIFSEIQILDPDGWDRTPGNFYYEWNEEKITIEEYNERMMLSTCMFKITPAKLL